MPYDLPRISLPTTAASHELARLPAAIRRQALFSARLNTLGPVVEIGHNLKEIIDGKRSLSEARRDIRHALDAAGYQPPAGSEGGLKDHRSRRRLDLILQQNLRNARGYAKYAADMQSEILDLWPAQEFIRVMKRKEERTTWQQRWLDAGGQLYGRRMIALKTSPVWVNLSRFGNPWPPYDYGSGMGVIDVSREEAERLGLITPEQTLTPETLPFPEEATSASLPDLDSMPALQQSILKAFGPGARFDEGVLTMPTTTPIVGAEGSAKKLGLGGLKERATTPPPSVIPEKEALALMDANEATAKAPDGQLVHFTRHSYDHWQHKPEERTRRIHRLRLALATVQEPMEVWEKSGRTFYLKLFDDGAKKQHMLVIVNETGTVETWIPTTAKRTGTLLYKEGAR